VTIPSEDGEIPGVEISVVDRGPGIPADTIKKIFDPFFTTKEVGKGTGLGLPLVFRFAKENGGEVRVRSKVGRGSKFSITLPRTESAGAATGDAASADVQNMSFDGRTALLVDDEPALVAAYGEMLRNLGLKVREFTSAYEALAAVEDEENPVDILVSDVLMPDLDGPKLVDLAKSLKPELKALLVTGQPERMGKDKTAALDKIDILQKPFEMAQLRSALAAVFSRVDEAA
jgi:two-component system cell cycle sensor histidine kinase/response regulator CckA